MKLFTVSLAAAIALTAAPALAKSKKHHRAYHHHYSQVQPGFAGGYYGPYVGGYGGGWYGPGWRSRAVSDPSIGHAPADVVSRHIGRCVEDLGYGRYEYCGW
ncbi:MAG: hypothetical protein E6G97_04320 [Alphaproteobacteria bacterium]|nr:MAG: hypothetical protein E6G97_04320 [Alphaproteobacteria bacterium]